MRARRTFLAAAVLLAAALWAALGGAEPAPEVSFEEAERILVERFAAWRARTEAAAERVARLAVRDDGDADARFREAAAIAAAERVDGVAVLERGNRARVWAGRTFDLDPARDLAALQQGVDVVDVLDLPAHRVLFAARAARDTAAVAFLAFDERFPSRRNLAELTAQRAGLREVRQAHRRHPHRQQYPLLHGPSVSPCRHEYGEGHHVFSDRR
jgi:hypothetical protein